MGYFRRKRAFWGIATIIKRKTRSFPHGLPSQKDVPKFSNSPCEHLCQVIGTVVPRISGKVSTVHPQSQNQDPLALFFLKADKVKPSPRVPYLWREVWWTPLVLGRPLEPLTPRQAKGRLTPTESRRDLRESKVRPPKRNLGPKSANESLREITRRDPREIRPTALPPRRHVAPSDDATAPIPTATALPSPSSPFLLDPSVAGRPNTLHEHTLGM
nr:uncharacterized protein LOC115266761 [Aedes albopictus]